MRIITIFITLSIFFQASSQIVEENKAPVDYLDFLKVSEEVQNYRAERLIDIETFNQYANDYNTIILDTRSRAAYDDIHIEGAVHLNFSEFTTQSLADFIPNKNTRILIYCNNNFISEKESLMSKLRGLALNIPTFINLYGYDYKNIYELGSYLNEDDPRVKFVKK